MNVNFIRTGVLISMNLDPEGVIAAAGSTYIRRHIHTHTHTHKYIHITYKYYMYTRSNFFSPHPTRNGFRGFVLCLRTSPLIGAADLRPNTIPGRPTALGQSRSSVVLTL